MFLYSTYSLVSGRWSEGNKKREKKISPAKFLAGFSAEPDISVHFNERQTGSREAFAHSHADTCVSTPMQMATEDVRALLDRVLIKQPIDNYCCYFVRIPLTPSPFSPSFWGLYSKIDILSVKYVSAITQNVLVVAILESGFVFFSLLWQFDRRISVGHGQNWHRLSLWSLALLSQDERWICVSALYAAVPSTSGCLNFAGVLCLWQISYFIHTYIHTYTFHTYFISSVCGHAACQFSCSRASQERSRRLMPFFFFF